MSERKIGSCYVDSGQIMMVDPCYVLHDNNKDVMRGEVLNEETGCLEEAPELKSSYDNLLEVRGYVPEDEKKQNGWHEFDGGVVFDTLYGDGEYDVTADVDSSSGRCRSVTIHFDQPELEDDEEDDY